MHSTAPPARTQGLPRREPVRNAPFLTPGRRPGLRRAPHRQVPPAAPRYPPKSNTEWEWRAEVPTQIETHIAWQLSPERSWARFPPRNGERGQWKLCFELPSENIGTGSGLSRDSWIYSPGGRAFFRYGFAHPAAEFQTGESCPKPGTA